MAAMESKSEAFAQKALREYGFVGAATIAFHPFSLVRTLVQVGIEPIRPQVHMSYMGKEIFIYPGLFAYLGHIQEVDGWGGLFRGCVPSLLYALCIQVTQDVMRRRTRVAVNAAMDKLAPRGPDVPDNEEAVRTLRSSVRRAVRDFVISSTLSITTCVMFHPLRVVAVRSMAQFSGRETAYDGVLGGLRELYSTEGVSGLFAGLAPLLIAKVGSLFIRYLIEVILEQAMYHWTPDQLHESFGAFKQVFANFLGSHIVYPYNLMSTMMVLNGSGLVAGRTPEFESWLACRTYLIDNGLRYRGSNIVFSRRNVLSLHSDK